jgi:catechol 2,3-dioxygenase-like lactoylglutathione lyase family enzyme
MDQVRRIDHLVLAVHDLDAAAAFYQRIGFQVGARNRHPWGTENRLVQFPSSFLELITVGADAHVPPHGPRSFSFGAFVHDYLAEREGLAMLALHSADAASAAVEFASEGVGDFEPFSFERDGRGPEGTTSRVGFTLAFAQDPRLRGAGFFVCQQHAPARSGTRSFSSTQTARPP